MRSPVLYFITGVIFIILFIAEEVDDLSFANMKKKKKKKKFNLDDADGDKSGTGRHLND